MLRPQVVLLPAVLIASMFVVLLTGLISNPQVAEASDAPAAVKISTPVPAPAQDGACSLPQRYPAAIQQWCGLIEQYAAKYELDAGLVAAVMLQESGGDPQAYSHSGAVGLMQVMPRDGLASQFQCSGHPCFSARPSMAELFDPEFNISDGLRMLAGLIEKTGSLRNALKSYEPMDSGYSYADK